MHCYLKVERTKKVTGVARRDENDPVKRPDLMVQEIRIKTRKSRSLSPPHTILPLKGSLGRPMVRSRLIIMELK